MSRRARRKPLELEEDAPARRTPPPRRWRRRLIVAALLLVALIALAPTIICATPLWRTIAGLILPADAAQLDIDKLSVGWVTPIELQGITVSEPTGERIVQIERLQISRSLVDLILARRSLGTIRIDRPHAYLTVRPDGSNLEDLASRLAKAFEDDSPEDDSKDKRPTRFRFELIDGIVETADVATGNRWIANSLNVTLDRTEPELAALKFAASGQLGPPAVEGTAAAPIGPDTPGSFSVALEPLDSDRQQARLHSTALPLGAIEPWCRRIDPTLELVGWLTGEGSASWKLPKPIDQATNQTLPTLVEQIRAAEWTTSGRFVVDNIVLQTALLSGDRVALQNIEFPWRVANREGTIQVEELQLRTPIGSTHLRGAIGPEELTSLAWAEFIQLKEFELQSNVDLAGVAARLPQLLQVRADTSITSGRAALTLRSQMEGQSHVLTGILQTADLAATRAGVPVRWDQPINASFTLRDPAEKFKLESLRCNSEFLTLDASGNAAGLRGTLSFDLDQLAQQLGQFVDLGAWTLAGTGSADFNWGSSAPGQFTATMHGDLSQLIVTYEGRDMFREPKLRIEGTAIGDRPANQTMPTRLASGEFVLRTDSDQLQASLAAPVDLTAANWSCPITANVNGSLTSWVLRLRPWLNLDQWDSVGSLAANLSADIGPPGVRVGQADISLTDLRASSPEWLIVEPRVQITGSGSWQSASGLIEVPDAQFISSTVAARIAELRWPTGEANPGEASGNVALRADLGRLSAWRTRAPNPSPWSLAGRIVGGAQIRRDGTQVAADLNLNGDNLQLQDLAPTTGGSPRVVWQEPKVTIVGHAAYDSPTDRISLDNLQVTSNMLRLTTTGAIDELSTIGRTQFNSTVDYDLAQITPLLAPFIGRGVTLAGRHQGRVELRGQLADPSPASMRHWSQRWQGRFDFPWTGATLYGLPVGPGKLAGVMIEGIVTVTPIDATVGEGRLQASPLVRLDPPPSLATLTPGQVISNVRVTPEVSNTLLKYIAPALAETTRSEGLFSLRLDQTTIPLAEPARADISGELTIHSAQVHPGAMVAQWTSLAREVESLAKGMDPTGFLNRESNATPVTLVSITDQKVKFRLVNGRVHSEGLDFNVGNVTLRTSGSVGLDETLQLTLELPIQDRWIEGRPLLVSLRGKSIKIPVLGTFRNWKIDRGALAGLSRQMLQGTAQEAIGNELNRALDGLFKPKPKP